MTVTSGPKSWAKRKAPAYVAGSRKKTFKILNAFRKSKASTSQLFKSPSILPAKKVVKMVGNMEFFVAVGQGHTAGNYMNFRANDIFVPYSTTYFPTQTVAGLGQPYAMSGTYTNGFATTIGPIGYTFWTSAYEAYKVKKFRIKVTVQPTNSQDTANVCLLPLGNDAIPNTAAANVNMNVFGGQPGAKSKVVSNAVSEAGNSLILAGTVADLLGLSYQQWEDQPFTQVGNSPGGLAVGNIGLFIQEMAGANVAPLTVSINMTQWVEFSDVNNANFLN